MTILITLTFWQTGLLVVITNMVVWAPWVHWWARLYAFTITVANLVFMTILIKFANWFARFWLTKKGIKVQALFFNQVFHFFTCYNRNLSDNPGHWYTYGYIYHWNKYLKMLDNPGLNYKRESIVFPDNNEIVNNHCLEHKDSSIDFEYIWNWDNYYHLNIRIGMTHLGNKIDRSSNLDLNHNWLCNTFHAHGNVVLENSPHDLDMILDIVHYYLSNDILDCIDHYLNISHDTLDDQYDSTD